MNTKEVGSRIAALRKAKGWTQKQLAEQLNVTDKAVSRWELGLNYPDLPTVEPLARLLDISPSALLGLEQTNADAAVSASTELYQQGLAEWLRELRQRAWIGLAVSVLLLAAQLYLSWYLDRLGQYGLPQAASGGMSGLIGTMIGFGIWTVHSSSKRIKQCKEAMQNAGCRPDTQTTHAAEDRL